MPPPFDSVGQSQGVNPADGAPSDEVPAVAASDLVAACEAAWAAIQTRHPQVPDTVVVLGSGVERGRLVKLGHWWGGQWRVGGEARGEVLLAGEALHLPPESVFEVLLHEAAHGLNASRGIRDTSRGGRYHNANFKAAAAEVGLKPGRMDPYGWARTTLTESTAERYADAITGIEAHMRLRGLPASRGVGVEGNGMDGLDRDGAEAEGGGPGDRERTTQRAAECGCEPARKLRMAPSVLARGPVVCGLCQSAFAVPDQAEHLASTSIEAAGPTGASAQAVVHDFVSRRRQAVAEEQPPVDLVAEGQTRLAEIEAAIAAVAVHQPDGERMVAAFAERRAEIAAWFEATVTADVVPLPGSDRPTELDPEHQEPHSFGLGDPAAPFPLDLRTIELPVAEVEPGDETTARRVQQPAPERTMPEVER